MNMQRIVFTSLYETASLKLRECDVFKMKERCVDLVRRNSGGGAVYHDLGNANYCIMMPRHQFDRKTGAALVNRALHSLDIPSNVNERYDIVINGLKVSGSAFKLVRDSAYHHGTMLIDTDLKTISELLNPSVNHLQGLGTASVKSFVTRLRDHSYTVTYKDFLDSVSSEFSAFTGESSPVVFLEQGSIPQYGAILEDAKRYQQWEWLFGQTPSFSHQLKLSQSPHTNIDIVISVERGIIKKIERLDSSNSSMLMDSLKIFIDAPYDHFLRQSCLNFQGNVNSTQLGI